MNNTSATPFVILKKTHNLKQGIPVTSWFGGRPRLGDVPWPCHSDGTPGQFIAQISLADLPTGYWSSCLPASGALAYFLSGVRYVPHPGDTDTPPPSPLKPIFHPEFWEYLDASDATTVSAETLRHWPIEPILIDTPYSTMEEKVALLVETIGMTNSANATAYTFSTTRDVYPFRYLDLFISSVENRLAAMKARKPDAFRFGEIPSDDVLKVILAPIEQLLGYIKSARKPERYAPLDPIPQPTWKTFSNWIGQISFIAAYIPNVRWSVDAHGFYKVQAMFDMIRSKIETWDTLDDTTAKLYHSWVAGRPRDYHQIFGTGPFYGHENTIYKDYHLLLRFHEDAGLGWDTEDGRDMKFLISNDDLVAGRWENAFVDFSSGA